MKQEEENRAKTKVSIRPNWHCRKILTGKKKTYHNTIFLKIAAEAKTSNKEKIKIWKINEKNNWKTYENVIKEELKRPKKIKLDQHCPTEAHKLL